MNNISNYKETKTPKYISYFFTVLVSPILLFFFTLNTYPQDTGKDTQIIRVGIYHNPPLEDYVNGEAIGFYPTLLNAIARENNWKIKYTFGTWNEVYEKLLNNKLDLLPNIVYLPERDSLVDFNKKTVLLTWSKLYLSQNTDDIHNFYELKNKKIGILKGGAHGVKFKKMMSRFKIELTYVEFKDYESIAKAIDQNEISGGVFNNFVGFDLSKIYSFNKNEFILDPNVLLFATKKGGNKELLNSIDTQLELWNKNSNSLYFKTINTWITNYGNETFIFKYLKWYLLIILGVTLIVISWIRTIRISRKKAILSYKASIKKLAIKEEEKQKIQSELHSTEDYLQTIFDSTSDVIFIHDGITGEILDVNQQMCNQFGYTKEEVLTKDMQSLSSSETNYTKAEAQKWLQKVKNKGPQTFEWQAKHKDGHVFWVEVSIKFVTILGKPRFIATSRNIDDRKRAKEKIKSQNEKLLLAGKIAKFGFIDWNFKTNEIKLSPEAKRIYQMSEDEKDPITFMNNHIHPDDLKTSQDGLELASKDLKKYDVELRIIRDDKSLVWVNAQAQLIKNANGNSERLLGTILDITKRKKIEEDLFEKEQQMSSIYNTVGDVIFYLTVENEGQYRFTSVNKAFTNAIGIKKEAILGKLVSEIIPEPSLSLVLKKYKEAITKKAIVHWEETTQYPSGEKIGAVNIAPIFDNKGNCTQLVGSVHDISEIKKALEKATESDRLKTAFLQNISHEIRTPMNGISGFAELLQNPELTSEKQQKYIEIITKSSNRLLGTLNDLMDISKLETGQIKLNLSKTIIYNELKHLFDLYGFEASNKGIQLKLDNLNFSKELTLETDQIKLHAILTNLIKNAIKYSHQGIINFGCIEKPNYFEFYIKDSGIGIPKNRQEAIFERFVQADIEDTNVYEGAGLGLSISKSYVEMLGGKIWITSKVNESSQFYFTIPKNKVSKEKTVSKTKLKNTSSFENLKVLIAEDEIYAYEYLKVLLNNLKCTLFHAKNGIEAVEICKANPELDLVLMDVKMPKMDGYEATRKIRKFNKNIYIISQTAYALQGDKEKALEAGCNAYITKPIKKNVLINLVSTYMNLKNKPSKQ
ncbi:MAG: PAS domain S-box protein [Lutibacter sp.]|uniref:PAS domain S-box protein n=1 Tax=Lutibacter sp. TaxID=1925666 RepID=UPI00385FDB93